MFFPRRICVLDTKGMEKPSDLLSQEVLVRVQLYQAAAAAPTLMDTPGLV